MTRVARAGWVLGGSLALSIAAPSVAHACHSATLCVQFDVTTDDMAFGDLPELQPESDPDAPIGVIPGRGVRILYIPPPPEPAGEVFADVDTGCFTIETEYATGFRLIIYPEALFPVRVSSNPADPLEQTVHVWAFDSQADFESCIDFGTDDDGTDDMFVVPCDDLAKPWVCNAKAVGADDTVTCQISVPENDPVGRIFPFALETLYRWNAGIDGAWPPSVHGVHHMNLATYLPPPMSTEELLGAFGTTDKVYFKEETTRKKFLIAHEMGHWLQGTWAPGSTVENYFYGTVPPGELDAQAIDPDCQFWEMGTNATHGIRSAEYASTAIVEGTAHFLSTYAFDSTQTQDAIFQYYKTIDVDHVVNGVNWDAYDAFADPAGNNSRVSLTGGTDNNTTLGGRSAWVENMCGADWTYVDPGSGVLQEISTEMDWQRFWWQFLSLDATGVPTEKPNLFHILRLYQYHVEGMTGLVRWTSLSDAITDAGHTDVNPYVDRFDYFTDENGVYNGAP